MPDMFARHFCRHRDGSWTCISPAEMNGPNGRVQVAAGSRFYPGTIFMGFDIAAWLEERYSEHAPSCEDVELQQRIGRWTFN